MALFSNDLLQTLEASVADVETAVRDIRERRASEVKRFRDLYEIDLTNDDNYDLIVDTSHATPEEVARKILDALEEWKAK